MGNSEVIDAKVVADGNVQITVRLFGLDAGYLVVQAMVSQFAADQAQPPTLTAFADVYAVAEVHHDPDDVQLTATLRSGAFDKQRPITTVTQSSYTWESHLGPAAGQASPQTPTEGPDWTVLEPWTAPAEEPPPPPSPPPTG
jgi:hypothetical protein